MSNKLKLWPVLMLSIASCAGCATPGSCVVPAALMEAPEDTPTIDNLTLDENYSPAKEPSTGLERSRNPSAHN